jgi:signal transduction histidine kinase/DNA-binding response OmpR family regulator
MFNFLLYSQEENLQKSYELDLSNKTDLAISNFAKFVYSNTDSANYYKNISDSLFNTETEISRGTELYYYESLTRHMVVRRFPKDSIKSTILQGLEIADEINYTYYQISFSNFMAIMYNDQSVLALEYLKRVNSISSKLTSKVGLFGKFISCNNITQHYLILQDTTQVNNYFSQLETIRNNNIDKLNELHHYHYYITKSKVIQGIENKTAAVDSAIKYLILPSGGYYYTSSIYEKINIYNQVDSLKGKANELFFKEIDNKELPDRFKMDFYTDLIKNLLHDNQHEEVEKLYYKYKQTYGETPYIKNDIENDYLAYLIYRKNKPDSALYYINRYTEQLKTQSKNDIDSIIFNYNNQFKESSAIKELEIQSINHQKAKEKQRLYIIILILIFVFILIIWAIKNKQKNRELSLISDKLKTEEEINLLKTTYLENLSHEIKTPLTIISNSINFLNDSDKELEHAKTVTNRLKNSIDNILQLTHDEQYSVQYTRSKIEIYPLIHNSIKDYQPLLNTKNLTLKTSTNIDETIYIESNEFQIRTIVSNLLSNAIKFASFDSEISIWFSIKNNHLEYRISNDGNTISEEDIPNIFKRYYRGKQNLTPGQGIGLYIIKKIIDHLHGNIQVLSENNKTTFSFSIPINHIDGLVQEQFYTTFYKPINSISNDFYQQHREKVLIVEDDLELIKYYDLCLPTYDKKYATNIKEAKELLALHNFDCIISDIKLPEKDGFYLKRYLDENHIKSPVIFVTAQSEQTFKVKALSLGVLDYLTKPFDPNELIARINNLINNQKSKKEELDSINQSEKTTENFDDKDEISFLERVIKIAKNHISDKNFKVGQLATEVFYSESQLRRLIKKQTGLSPNKLMLEIRLKHAYELIYKNPSLKIFEVQEKVGITSPPYFAKVFRDRFGISPSDFQQKMMKRAEGS